MIQITNVGTFGRRVGAKVVPTTAADGPFETDKATEAMLVAQGVAEYVDPTAAAANASQTQQAAPVSYDRMRKQELFDLAKDRGLYNGQYDDIAGKKLIELLKTSDEGGNDAGSDGSDPAGDPDGAGSEGEDGEQPPVIDAEGVVE